MSSTAGTSTSPFKVPTTSRRRVPTIDTSFPRQLPGFASPIATQPNTPTFQPFLQTSLSHPPTPTALIGFTSIPPVELTNHWQDLILASQAVSSSAPPVTQPTTTSYPGPHPDPPKVPNAVTTWLCDGISFTIRYTLDVVRGTMGFARFWLSGFLFLFLIGFLTYRLYAYYSPGFRVIYGIICIFPGTSRLTVCQPTPSNRGSVRSAGAGNVISLGGSPTCQQSIPEYHHILGSAFDALLDHAKTSIMEELALGMWKAEMETENMVTVVRTSRLQNRVNLTQLLEDFADDSEATISMLHDLQSNVMGAIDRYDLSRGFLHRTMY
jgi:hypothetical protein